MMVENLLKQTADKMLTGKDIKLYTTSGKSLFTRARKFGKTDQIYYLTYHDPKTNKHYKNGVIAKKNVEEWPQQLVYQVGKFIGYLQRKGVEI